MLRVVEDRIVCRRHRAGEFDFFSRIKIAIETRKIAAGDFQAQRVAFKKHVAGGPEIDGDLVDLPGIHQSGVLRGGTITHS